MADAGATRLFQRDGRHFVVDLQTYRVMEIDDLTREIMARESTDSDDATRVALSSRFAEGDVDAALTSLAALTAAGHLSSARAPGVRPDRADTRYLCPNPATFTSDIRQLAGGVPIALHYLLRAVGEAGGHVDVCGAQAASMAPGVRSIATEPEHPSFLSRLIDSAYDGILLHSAADTHMIPYTRGITTPVVVPLYTMRGHGGAQRNQVLLWYSAFRGYDAFVSPSKSVGRFYEQYGLDTSCFHASPYGVDHAVFRPLDKRAAQRQVAELIGDERALSMPIVGFLSRLQPEKGSGTYIQLARRFPDALFVAVSPHNLYEGSPPPSNCIYAGAQPRERIPLFLNAYDIHCFPSVVGEETFGMCVLEAMACQTAVVASDFDGIPEVVGDAGVLVETETHTAELGSVAGHVSMPALVTAVRGLLDNDDRRDGLAESARKRAKQFTWERAARDLMDLFAELNQRQRAHREIPRASVFLAPPLDDMDALEATISGATEDGRDLTMFSSYPQSPEEGLAMSLLRRHTRHEVQAVLESLAGEGPASDTLRRIQQLIATLATE